MRARVRPARWPLDDEGGATSIEYALLGGLIAAAIIGMVSVFGGTLAEAYATVNRELLAAM